MTAAEKPTTPVAPNTATLMPESVRFFFSFRIFSTQATMAAAVGTSRIGKDRQLEWRDQRLLRGVDHVERDNRVAAAKENTGPRRQFGIAREDGVLDETLHILELDAGVDGNHVVAGIGCHIDIERAHQLEQGYHMKDRFVGHCTLLRLASGQSNSCSEPVSTMAPRLLAAATSRRNSWNRLCRRSTAPSSAAASALPAKTAGRSPGALTRSDAALRREKANRLADRRTGEEPPWAGSKWRPSSAWSAPMPEPKTSRSSSAKRRQDAHQHQMAEMGGAPLRARQIAKGLTLGLTMHALAKIVEDEQHAPARRKLQPGHDRRHPVAVVTTAIHHNPPCSKMPMPMPDRAPRSSSTASSRGSSG